VKDLWYAVAAIAAHYAPNVRKSVRQTAWMLCDLRNALSAALTASAGPTCRELPRTATRWSLARRAEEYMRERLTELLCIDAICAEFCVSRRCLEYAFLDVCGTSPSRYFRLLRLHEVRRRLKSGRRETSVTREATKLGFNHLGLFSTQYRQQFGETPSATLASTAKRDNRPQWPTSSHVSAASSCVSLRARDSGKARPRR
jgi:AraC-like DNA-binding protein